MFNLILWRVISIKNTPHQFYRLSIKYTGWLKNVRVGYKTYGAGEFFECSSRLQNLRVGYKTYRAGEFLAIF